MTILEWVSQMLICWKVSCSGVFLMWCYCRRVDLMFYWVYRLVGKRAGGLFFMESE